MNGYKIVHKVLEAQFAHRGAAAARERIADLKREYMQTEDPQEKRNLYWQIQKAQSDLTLMPNKSYDMYRDY